MIIVHRERQKREASRRPTMDRLVGFVATWFCRPKSPINWRGPTPSVAVYMGRHPFHFHPHYWPELPSVIQAHKVRTHEMRRWRPLTLTVTGRWRLFDDRLTSPWFEMENLERRGMIPSAKKHGAAELFNAPRVESPVNAILYFSRLRSITTWRDEP